MKSVKILKKVNSYVKNRRFCDRILHAHMLKWLCGGESHASPDSGEAWPRPYAVPVAL